MNPPTCYCCKEPAPAGNLYYSERGAVEILLTICQRCVHNNAVAKKLIKEIRKKGVRI